jgi:DNA-binding NarL/FixJ family response regulator
MDDIADGFSIAAAIATKRGEFIPAARLLGAAEALRDDIGSRPALPERLLFDRCEGAVRQAVSDKVLAAGWTAGRSLLLDAAVAEAFAVLTEPTDAPTPCSAHGLELTAREQDVLRLLVLGRTDREIADALFISPRTAQGHVARLFDKLGVNTRTAAVAAALQGGLIDG